MIILAVETSTPWASVALVEDDHILTEVVIEKGLTHSKTLLPSVNEMLSNRKLTVFDLDLLAVGAGPGSFTGLRIGLSAVKGLAWAASKPLVGVNSLETMAQGTPLHLSPLCPMMDARKSEVYSAVYERNGNGLSCRLPMAAISPEDLARSITEKTYFFGDGAEKYSEVMSGILKEKFVRTKETPDYPKATVTAVMARKLYENGIKSDPALITPIYIRPSDAELNWNKKIK